jgi:L-fuconolactonase
MKPQIRDEARGPEVFGVWADGMSRLAEETAACVKFSGLVTEAADGWSIEDLRPYAHHVIASFGADRVMWGSDWPVCQLQASYARWRETAEALTEHLSAGKRERVFGGTAAEFYRI